ncbi:uncharacterized protein LOC119079910 isoform X2 [Bradysia coprophila]|uniref:uncharacterized protein LOC119079910 isoform X2 n=1 Tax=Bradysia coprophila TaxID=38358 RepID=UPI00187D6F64|nr:uncharacterized protein LOC119079910 isoform X2 [Bradysia coprophila]
MVESIKEFFWFFKVFILFGILTRNYAARYRPIYSFIVGQSHIFPQLSEEIRNQTEYSNKIYFNYYNNTGELIYHTTIRKLENFASTECDPKGKFAIVVPGWQESCDEPWVQELISKLNHYRGGCIMCMNFSTYANDRYVRLVRSFDAIAHVLHIHLLELERIGFDMTEGYLFGFSFGGRLVCEAARRLGIRVIKDIDVCDMAGPPFDIRGPTDFTLSAQNVQCIHTNSGDKGTRHFTCHQNWRLGNCGFSQDAALPAPLGSHGLCPYMYVNAFENDFYAVEKPAACQSNHPARNWPTNFKMGYLEDRKRFG